MREIKFRAWDRKKKELFPVDEIKWPWNGGNVSGVHGHDDEEGGAYTGHGGGDNSFAGGERFILMQYTGLKDKNGKEVYEGDIVVCSSGCSHDIIWRKEYGGTFGGGMPVWYLNGLKEGYAWTKNEEIIGNVYQNPELLQTN